MSLTITGLSKTYPNGVRALRDISLTIGNNMFGLLGPNGAGKSTLMRTIATLQEPDSGSITLDGINVLTQKDAVRQTLGYLPQEFGVYPKMSALDMLSHLAVMKGITNAGERKAVVEALLNQTNLWDFRKKALSTYSGGMKQRFGIAQALLGKPRLIIVDEPTAGLDPAERNRFLNLLSSIGRDVTVILSTHIVEDVRELCPRMAIIASGQLLLEGSPAESLAALEGKIWSKVVATDDELRALEANMSIISSHLVAGQHEVRVFADSAPGEGFRIVDSGLEDVYFLNLAQQGQTPPPPLDSFYEIVVLSPQAKDLLTLCSSLLAVLFAKFRRHTMSLFLEFFRFELKFRLKSLSTYVYFLLWFLLMFLCVAAEDFGAAGNGKQLLNGPFTTITTYSIFTLYGSIVIAAIFGTSVLRDFQRDTFQLIFTKPISKFAYLGGRWAGSFVACVVAFSGLVFGEALGTLAPWADHTRIAGGHFWWYLQPFLSIVCVQIFFLGSIFFMVSALSRKIFVVYVQGIALLVVYFCLIAAFSSTRSLEHFWSGIFDPIGWQLDDVIARYWTVAEKNSQLFSWSPHVGGGVFFYNRCFWIFVGFVAMATTYRFFPMSVEALTARSQGRRAAKARTQDELDTRPRRSLVAAALPLVHQVFARGISGPQLASLTRVRVTNITRELPFWILTALVAFFAMFNGHFAGRVGEANAYPVTFLMLNSVEGLAILILYAIATFYAGELVWRERDTRFAGIHDALPMRETTDWLSKFFALVFVEFLLVTVMGICGVIMQTVGGFYHYDLLQYAKELYLVVLPGIIAYILLAFFVQTVVSNKFLGHGIVIGVFVLQPILFRFGVENSLLNPGQTTSYTYSDMNGYGHFVQALLWSNIYWLSVFAVLAVLSIALSRRGAEDAFAPRIRLARQRLPRLAPLLSIFILAAISSGLWFYYNSHVRNEFLIAKARRDIQAQYERDFKKYEFFPQPKVIAVDTAIDLDPAHRAFSGAGHFVLQNKTPSPIQQIHIVDQKQSVADVVFDRPFHKVSSSARDLYSIYQLETPLAPGETVNLNFKVGYQPHGFRDSGERPELAYNGTFFDSDYYPHIGYDAGFELDDPRRRREEKLCPVSDLPARGDAYGSVTNLFTPTSDWITYRTVVSTPDLPGNDQIALSPGYLKSDWHSNGRHYFSYDMGQVKILDFFNFISGRYQVKKQNYNGVSIEVYYDKHHPWDVDDMMEGVRGGLDYYQANYSPFQFQQFRIIEFPRYRQFAQSFPNTSPFTETFFISRVLDPKKDIDFTYFVTAHELAHQWWAHQLIGGRVAGSNMMSESLAEYSALRVAEKKYGEAQMHKFLSHELDGYLRGRSGETRKEPPLALVQREQYVWYQKGSLILYALSDYIGEDKVNLALKNFLLQYRYANANDAQSGPYPDTRQLEDALRAQTPANLQYFIDDSFEKITLYDNKAISATAKKQADGKYKVTVVIEGKKAYADGNGVEAPATINDLVDVGVLAGKKGEDHPLAIRKERITGGRQTFEFLVGELPTRAGIDPINKLIDRNLDDNSIDVTLEK